MNLLIPPLITTLDAIFPSTEFQAIIWFGAITIWVLLTIIYPTFLLLTIQVDKTQRITNILTAIALSIFSILMITKIWYWIPTLAALTTDGFIQAMFYIGITIQILMTTTIAPIMIILANKTDNV